MHGETERCMACEAEYDALWTVRNFSGAFGHEHKKSILISGPVMLAMSALIFALGGLTFDNVFEGGLMFLLGGLWGEVIDIYAMYIWVPSILVTGSYGVGLLIIAYFFVHEDFILLNFYRSPDVFQAHDVSSQECIPETLRKAVDAKPMANA